MINKIWGVGSRRPLGLGAFLLLISVGCGGPQDVEEAVSLVRHGRRGIPNSYIVAIREQAPAGTLDAVIADYELEVTYLYRRTLRGFAARMDPMTAVRVLRDPRVQIVEQDAKVEPHLPPEWNLERITQPGRLYDGEFTRVGTGEGVRVYVIDTGIRVTHEQFEGRAEFGFSAIGGSTDSNGHGTAVAGIIAGREVGVAPGAQVVAVQGFSGGPTSIPVGTAQILAAVEWITNDFERRGGPAVANMSGGLPASPCIVRGFQASIAHGITYVVSAGNDGIDACKKSPANVREAITVGATMPSDRRVSFPNAWKSNFGSCVDLFAPGNRLLSLGHQNDHALKDRFQGTSASAPHVAGAAALYLSKHPQADPALVEQVLKEFATPNMIENPAGSPQFNFECSVPRAGKMVGRAGKCCACRRPAREAADIALQPLWGLGFFRWRLSR